MAGIYLHIPFCKTRCIYCDFYSTTKHEWKERYIQAVCRELELRKDYLKGKKIETIYFGGGTPSLLQTEDFKKIFHTIQKIYGMDNCQEITLEANPDDLHPEYIQKLATLPFNRISIGIQTFNDNILNVLHRRHSASQAIQVVKDCKRFGFNNISIDLMYGLPGETRESWEKDLKQAIDLNIEHISAYHLIYEEGTTLWKMRQRHQVDEIDEDSSVDFFAMMIHELSTAGFEHYEISNFCKHGMYSKHNSSYWTGIKYLGIGPSAHSYNENNRQWNIASLDKYIIGIEKKEPLIEIETLDLYTRYNDFIITSLRTMWGLSLVRLQNEFGKELHDYCLKNADKYFKNDKLIIKDQTIYLTPKGIFISDGIMSDLLWIKD